MARLPQPGGDSGNWGDILNEYLSQSLTTSGTIRSDAITSTQLADNSFTSAQLAPNSVGSAALASSSVSESHLASPLQTKLNAKADSSSLATVATSGSYTDLLNRPTIPPAQPIFTPQ